MKIGIMQPYFMPYFSYFKLIALVDKFIILDDVNYINKGWVNRNQILVNNRAFLFTLPLEKRSQNKKINELSFSKDIKWQENFLKTIRHSYSKAPYFTEIYFLLEKIMGYKNLNLSSFIKNSILQVCSYLNIKTEIISSSVIFQNQELTGQLRIADICRRCGGNEYYNLIGGKKLYNPEFFKNNNILIKFLQENNVFYKQYDNEFVKHLSIIDYLMFNERAKFMEHSNLIKYE